MNKITVNSSCLRIGVARAALFFASALLWMDLAPAAMAGTVFTYTGNEYNLCGGTYCAGGPYALSIVFETTLAVPALQDMPLTDITSTITSYEFTDGSGLVLNSGNNAAGSIDIRIGTNASGNVISWFAGAYTLDVNTQMQTNLNSPIGFVLGADFSETTLDFLGDFGFVSANPGTWTVTAVPEPSAFVLLGMGFVFFGVFRKRLARRPQP